MKAITLDLNIVENGQTIGFIRCLQNRYTSRKGFIKEIKEKLGLKSRSTAQTAYQRFLKTNSYVAKKPPGRPEKLSKKRAKTNSSKSGKRVKNNIRTSKSTANLFQRQKQDVLFEES